MHRDKQPPQTAVLSLLPAVRLQSLWTTPAKALLPLSFTKPSLGLGWAPAHDALEPSQGRSSSCCREAAAAAEKLCQVCGVQQQRLVQCKPLLGMCELQAEGGSSQITSAQAAQPQQQQHQQPLECFSSFSVGFEVHTVSQPLCQYHTLWLTGSHPALGVKPQTTTTTTHPGCLHQPGLI